MFSKNISLKSFFFTSLYLEYLVFVIMQFSCISSVITFKKMLFFLQILGKWHVVQLVDNNLKSRDQNFCLEVDLQRVNDTLLREFWVIQGRGINFQLDVRVIKPGIWKVSDSLGGKKLRFFFF